MSLDQTNVTKLIRILFYKELVSINVLLNTVFSHFKTFINATRDIEILFWENEHVHLKLNKNSIDTDFHETIV